MCSCMLLLYLKVINNDKNTFGFLYVYIAVFGSECTAIRKISHASDAQGLAGE